MSQHAQVAVLAVLLQQQQQHCTPTTLWITHQPQNVAGFSYANVSGSKPFKCLASFSSHFRDILLVMQFSKRLGEKEQSLRDLYSCFLPNIVQYTCFCNAILQRYMS